MNRPAPIRRRSLTLIASIGLIVAGSLSLTSSPARALPGTPGVPGTASILFSEDFETPQASPPEAVKNYVSANAGPGSALGTTYTADANWLPPSAGGVRSACNGWVLNSSSTAPGEVNCDGTTATGAWSTLQKLATAVGTARGLATPATNHVVAAYTNYPPATPNGAGAMFETTSNTIIPTPGHYYAVSVWSVATNCVGDIGGTHYDPSLTLNLKINGAATWQPLLTGQNPCDAAAVPGITGVSGRPIRAAQFVSSAVLATTADALQMQVYNATASGAGNDAAFDLPQIIDVTPQMDKTFDPSPIGPGDVSTLTITITNTADLNGVLEAKDGWYFTDTLPTGLVVADTPNITTSAGCGATVVNATAGGTTVVVPQDGTGVGQGHLVAGTPGYCEIKVDVTSDTVGTYTNAPDDGSGTPGHVTGMGFLPPDPAPLEVLAGHLTLKKSASPVTVVDGQVVTYTFVVKNDGPVPVYNVSIDDGTTGDYTGKTDPGFSGSTAVAITCPDTSVTPLGVGKSLTCTGTYTATATDEADGLNNTAVANGSTDPAGEYPVEPSNPSTVNLPMVELTLTKDASPTLVSATGDVTYTITMENTGGVDLTNVTLTDPGPNGKGMGELTCDSVPAGASPVATGPSPVVIPSLLAGDKVECTATYTVTAADLAAGVALENTAAATSDELVALGEPPVTDDATVDIAGLKLVKTASPTTVTAAGQPVTFSFTVTNTGSVPLTDVTVTDAGVTGATGTITPTTSVPCVASLPIGATDVPCTGTFTYTPSRADIDSGVTPLVNTATASGFDPEEGTVASAPATANIIVAPVKSLSMVKTADTTDLIAGQVVTYSFTVKNTGTVTLSGITIAETNFTGAGTISYLTCPKTVLAPDESTICTAKYTVQQADVDAGTLVNDAKATGVAPAPPGGVGETVASEVSEWRLPATPKPSLGIVKGVDKKSLVVGDTLTFTFTVTNTGNLTVNDIAVVEGAFTGTGTLSPIDCGGVTSLTPGQFHVCTATYVVTQADVDAGTLTNTASAKGTAPGLAVGATVPVLADPSTALLSRTLPPSLSLAKTVDKSSARAGDTLTYSFAVTNTGQVDVTNLTIGESSFSGTGAMSAVTCPVTALAPGAKTVCTATYVVTAADVAKGGTLTNTAVASATDPQGKPVASAPSSALVALVAPVVVPPVTVNGGGIPAGAGAGAMGVLVGTLGLMGTMLLWSGRVVRRRGE